MIKLESWLEVISEILSKRKNYEVKIKIKEGDAYECKVI